MFVPFKIDESEILTLKTQYLPQRFGLIADKSVNFYKKIIERSIASNGVLDGAVLSSMVFPFEEGMYDVFISYSHNDKKVADFLYWFLTAKCRLNVFYDATIWNSADLLLEEIDNGYCRNKIGNGYNYKKRNFSTSHVHTLLSMAMMEAIKRSELFLLVESYNSVTLEDGIKHSTLSPWIYQETQFANYLPSETPERLTDVSSLRFFSRNIRIIDEHKELQIKYPTQTNGFHKLVSSDLLEMSKGKGTDALDMLYLRKGIIENPNH